MVRDIFRRALLISLGFAFLARPLVAQSGPDHRPGDHCQHQPADAGHGSHHQAAPCHEGAAHCNASATGLPAPDSQPSLASMPDAVPSAVISLLLSRATAPPTHPPLFSR